MGSWGASPAAPVYFVPPEIMVTPAPVDGTLRHRLRLSAGGDRLRLRLSNECGDQPLLVAAVSVGLAGEGGNDRPGTLMPVSFGGHGSIRIPAGAPVLSDPVELAVPPLGEIIVSLFFPQPFIPARSENVHRARLLPSQDGTLDEIWSEAIDVAVRPVVTGVSVMASERKAVIVCLGDSLTDGAGSEAKDFRSWTDILARRLHERLGNKAPAVVNAGIGGNQLIGALIGPSALARLDRDVFAVPGARHLVIFEGINDIGAGGRTIEGVARPLARAEDLIAGYRQIIDRARERNILVHAATLLPFRDSLFFLEEKEPVRQEVNDWIRQSGVFASVLDFEALLRDPARPQFLDRRYDSGDLMHPNAAGHRAMGASINLEPLQC